MDISEKIEIEFIQDIIIKKNIGNGDFELF